MKHSVEEIKLKNGARGLFIDVPNASVMSMQFQFRAGMRYAKSPDLAEIAHVVEHLSFGANSKYKSEQAFENEFAKNGAYHNAWTSYASICYESCCADFEWERIMELQRLSITQPRFNNEELKSEKSTIRTELTSYQNDYSRLLWSRIQQSIGEEVLTFPARAKTLSNIELKDIREHYRRTHTAENMRFIIAGKLHGRRRALIKMLEAWELKAGERFEVPRDELHDSPASVVRRKDASNLTFGFSWLTLRQLDPSERHAMNCLNHILNGTLSSRIFGQARKRGLVYGMGSSLSKNFHYTSWDFDGEVNLESAAELFDLIRQELSKVLNGDLSDEDIEAAKSYALGRYQMCAQTVGQIADFYADDYFLDNEIVRFDRTPDLINNVDKSTIVELAREFSSSGIHTLVGVGACDKAFISDLNDKLKI